MAIAQKRPVAADVFHFARSTPRSDFLSSCEAREERPNGSEMNEPPQNPRPVPWLRFNECFRFEANAIHYPHIDAVATHAPLNGPPRRIALRRIPLFRRMPADGCRIKQNHCTLQRGQACAPGYHRPSRPACRSFRSWSLQRRGSPNRQEEEPGRAGRRGDLA